MIDTTLRLACLSLISALVAASLHAQSFDTPMTRLRPIGEPSAVDQYRPRTDQTLIRETQYQQLQPAAQVIQAFEQSDSPRQRVELQQFDAPQLPGSMQLPGSTQVPGSTQLPAGGFTPPPSGFAPPTAPPITGNAVAAPSTMVPSGVPRGLPSNSGALSPVQLNPTMSGVSGDFARMAQPQLSSGFATIDNCSCISPPSNYVAGSAGCAPVAYQSPAYVSAPSPVGPSILPNGIAPRGGGIPGGPLISFGQQANPVQVGQGWFGQPVAYVPGQPIRNWVRYLFP